jgi:protein-tyrosine kinase
MDRIRVALDLARQERQRNLAAPPERDALDEPTVATGLPSLITYTKTKVFSPSLSLLDTNRIVAAKSDGEAPSAFRMLRTQVLQRMEERKWTSIAVLSPGEDEGKTTLAINLSISLANDQRHTVLLVDFDLKRPTVAEKLGINAQYGVDDVLRGTATVQDCLYHPDPFDRLVILPARAPLQDSSEMLAGPRVQQLLVDLRSRYPERLLVFDLPPILCADDALAFAPLVDCVLLVVAEGITQRADLLRSMELLQRVPVVGTVLNRSSHASSDY